jgi:hypothetical protein
MWIEKDACPLFTPQVLLVVGDLLTENDGAGLIDDADGEESSVQIDAVVESVLLGVEA